MTGTIDWLHSHRLTVVVGHRGSGKTEFAVNLALALAASDGNVALADLDVVNPYFCGREKADPLKARGITLIAPSPACTGADVPAMPVELNTLLHTEDQTGVIDIGGNATGARVLARYRQQLAAQNHQVLLVVNASRPLTATADQVVACLREIEDVSGLRVGGLVNNTHLCGQTTDADVLSGAALAESAGEIAKLPVVCHAVPARLAGEALQSRLNAPLFPMHLQMNGPWEEISSHKA